MNVLRWLLVLPGAYLAGFAISAFLLFAHMLSDSILGQMTRFDGFFAGLLAAGAAGYAGVLAGSIIAPSARKAVAKVLAALVTVSAAASVLFVYPTLPDGANGIASIVGCYLGFCQVSENE